MEVNTKTATEALNRLTRVQQELPPGHTCEGDLDFVQKFIQAARPGGDSQPKTAEERRKDVEDAARKGFDTIKKPKG